MNINDISLGESVFIDANIFIYHFTGVSQQCTKLLSRCAQDEIAGMTTANIILEVNHRLMVLEAANKRLISQGNLAKKLNNKPEIIQKLSDYQVTLKIPDMGIKIIPVDIGLYRKSVSYQKKFGLMTNDSILVAACFDKGSSKIVTRDASFLGIEGLTVYRPEDV